MRRRVPAWLDRLADGLLGKGKSLGTGLLLALLVWTLTRIVDGVLGSAAVEYAVSYEPAKMKDGSDASIVTVVLSNLSRDTAIRDLEVAITDPIGKSRFFPSNNDCVFPPPSWADEGACTRAPNGLRLLAPWLIPGTEVRAQVRYVGSREPSERPIVRIRPGDTSTKIRLIEPGIETWLARHEMALLVTLSLATLLLLGVSVSAGVRSSPDEQKGEADE